MNAFRACAVLVAFVGIALLVVHLRAEQVRSAARILRIESEWIELRRERWVLQTRAARLRAPQQVRDRLDIRQMGLVPPEVDTACLPTVRLASDRP